MTSKTGFPKHCQFMPSSTGMKDQMSARSQPLQLSVGCPGMVVITEFIRTEKIPDAFRTHGNSTKFSHTSIPIINKTLKKIR